MNLEEIFPKEIRERATEYHCHFMGKQIISKTEIESIARMIAEYSYFPARAESLSRALVGEQGLVFELKAVNNPLGSYTDYKIIATARVKLSLNCERIGVVEYPKETS